MKTALIIRHVAFEDLGSFELPLTERGYAAVHLDIGLQAVTAVSPAAPDLLIVLGGPIGAYQERDYPLLGDELALLKRRLAENLPTLGICLGAQLMARALGARVFPGEHKEIGWGPIALTAAGRGSALRHLATDEAQVLHWHGDSFDLPAGAVRLASTGLYENQAFSYGRNALALQFHPEVTVQGLERWFIGHAAEIAATPEVSVTGLREETARRCPALQVRARAFFEEWLASVTG